MKKILYVKYSNDRARRFAIRTLICLKDGVRTVEKKNMFPEGEHHIRQQGEYYLANKEAYRQEGFELIPCTLTEDGAVYDYVEGGTLCARIDALIAAGRETAAMDCVRNLCGRVMELYGRQPWECSEEFVNVFGDGLQAALAEYDVLYGSDFVNIDLTAENIILNDGREYVMDYEWNYNFPVPALYVVFRVVYTLLRSSDRRKFLSDRSFKEDLGLTPKLWEAFEGMERCFQQYVLKERTPAYMLYQDIGKPVCRVGKLTREIKDKNMPVIYFDMGGGFCEENKTEITFWKEEDGMRSYRYDLPEGVLRMRIDPCSTYCVVKNLEINGYCLLLDSLETNAVYWQDMLIFATDDPQIVIPVGDMVKKCYVRIQMGTYEEYALAANKMHQESVAKSREELEKTKAKAKEELEEAIQCGENMLLEVTREIKRQNEEKWNAYKGIDEILAALMQEHSGLRTCNKCFDKISIIPCENGITLTLWGWIFMDKERIDRGCVNVGLQEKELVYDIERLDVQDYYGGFMNATDCGFSFEGSFEGEADYAFVRFYSKGVLVKLVIIDLKKERVVEYEDMRQGGSREE